MNLSMFVAFAVAFPASAFAADALSDVAPHLNATYTTIVDYVAYLGVFGIMFYVTNRHRYKTTSFDEKCNSRALLRSDFKKIIASLGIGEIVYGVVRWVLQYYLIEIWQYEPFVSSVVAQAVAVVIYVIVMNFSVKATKMFKNNHAGNNNDITDSDHNNNK